MTDPLLQDSGSVWHVDGPLGQIRSMIAWLEGEANHRVYPSQETLRKIISNLRAAADAIDGRQAEFDRAFANGREQGFQEGVREAMGRMG